MNFFQRGLRIHRVALTLQSCHIQKGDFPGLLLIGPLDHSGGIGLKSLRCRGTSGHASNTLSIRNPLYSPSSRTIRIRRSPSDFPPGKERRALRSTILISKSLRPNSLLIREPDRERGWNLEQLEHLLTRDAEITAVDLEHRHMNRWS